MSSAAPTVAPSAWAPLRIGAFRALWVAVLVSNVGLWMQTVGAQWLLVGLPNAAVLVALVQTADTLPDVLFGVVGGALADTLDRRHILITVQAFMAVTGAALTVLSLAGQMPPALLLVFTFLLGSGSVFTLPAYQSLIPELVPRDEVTAAATLSSVNVNLARAVGPAVAGVLVGSVGVPVVFAIDSAAFGTFAVVAALWHPPVQPVADAGGSFIAAVRAGGRYVRYSPVVRRVLLRSALFLVPGTVLWALLPLVATRELGLGAGGYGLLLAALGIGAVAGFGVLGWLRATLSTNALIAAASIAYALTLVVIVLVSIPAVALLALLPAGMSWMAVLSTLNASLQVFLPAWVRARGLSIYLIVLFGSQAAGAVLWGALASPLSVRTTFLCAAGTMILGAATIAMWPLIDTSSMDRSSQVFWPEPSLALDLHPDSGPVLVRSVYHVDADDEAAFLAGMARVRLSRLRTGAIRWNLYRDVAVPRRFVEQFVVPSWAEHMQQHGGRYTGQDRILEERALAFAEQTPETEHLVAVQTG